MADDVSAENNECKFKRTIKNIYTTVAAIHRSYTLTGALHAHASSMTSLFPVEESPPFLAFLRDDFCSCEGGFLDSSWSSSESSRQMTCVWRVRGKMSKMRVV